jgi:signal peptidase II
MSATVRHRSLGFALAAVAFAADQLVKWIVAGPLAMDNGDRIELLPIFALWRSHNTGVSLSLFQADSPESYWLLVAVTSLIALGVTVWMLREKRFGDILALGLVLGGALGNILDRLRLGYVLDYADLHFGQFRPFMIFNLGDACITIGVLIILARSLFMREKPAETQSPTGEPQADPSAETH